MANWNVGSKGTQPTKISRTQPKKTPRGYASHPFGSTHKPGAPKAGMGKGSRRSEGEGTHTKDMRLKTPQR